MRRHDAKLVYPPERYQLVLQNPNGNDEFYGLDELESKKLKIFQAKYGCRHCFHILPDSARLNLNKFVWDEQSQSFQIDTKNKVSVQLNTLEGTIVEYQNDVQFY
jgi:hypothetical protein